MSDFASSVLSASVAGGSAFVDGAADGGVLELAKNLARVLFPNADVVNTAFGGVGELGAAADTFCVVEIPCAVAVVVTGALIRVEGAAGVAAVSVEGPFAAVGIFAGSAGIDEGALLDALEVVGVPNAIGGSLANGLVLGLVGAEVGHASLVGVGPFAIGIAGAGDLVGPSALAALAAEGGHVPQANTVGGAGVFAGGEATTRTARGGA